MREDFEVHTREVVGFAPLHPIVPDHYLLLPFAHVINAAASPWLAGATFAAASEYAHARGMV